MPDVAALGDFSPLGSAPFGWDVYTHTEVVPKPPPAPALRFHWRVGPIVAKSPTWQPAPPSPPSVPPESEFTVQLTADQQVTLSVSGEDRYGNVVPITGDSAWSSSDESIIQVTPNADDITTAVAVAVGPAGTAAVTFTNDVNRDGTGDFMGSLAIDVVAGEIAEVVITPSDPVAKT